MGGGAVYTTIRHTSKIIKFKYTSVQTNVQTSVQTSVQTNVQTSVQTSVQTNVQTSVQTGVPTCCASSMMLIRAGAFLQSLRHINVNDTPVRLQKIRNIKKLSTVS